MAIGGFDALIYEGRLPFLVEACSVNWLTTKISPPCSFTDSFITPSASLKIRRLTILLLSQIRSSVVSASSIPTKMSKPFDIAERILLLITTFACDTRCITARIVRINYFYLYRMKIDVSKELEF